MFDKLSQMLINPDKILIIMLGVKYFIHSMPFTTYVIYWDPGNVLSTYEI